MRSLLSRAGKKKKEKKKKDYASHRLLGRRGQELKVKRCCCCIVDSLLLSSFFFFLLKAHFWLVLTAVWWFYLVFMCLYIYIHDVYNDRDKHTNIQTSACMCGQLWVASDGLVACPLERRGSVKKSLFLAILFSPLDCCSTLGDMGSPEKKCCFAFDSKTSQMASLPTNAAAELTTQVSFNQVACPEGKPGSGRSETRKGRRQWHWRNTSNQLQYSAEADC